MTRLWEPEPAFRLWTVRGLASVSVAVATMLLLHTSLTKASIYGK
ncbi:MAG: hypothetical protein WBG73_11140 [Coleofasciculaceae cyanobacterium]